TDLTLSGDERSSAKKLAECFARGQRLGTIDDSHPAAEAASLFMIALRGIALDWTRRNASYSLTERGDIYIDYLLKALRPAR
ncbi:MAG: hypothetical protein IKR16_06500, partial [Firmicutes bacterium]|nr:hypothetical protein [Bacillota bacterium]